MLVLDTNALLWLSGGDDQLGPLARAAIQQAVGEGEVLFSAISVWEAAMLVRKGRYKLGLPVEGWRADLINAGLGEAPLDGMTAADAVAFVDLHDDPADRFILATALRRSAALVTSDRRLLAWCAENREPTALDART